MWLRGRVGAVRLAGVPLAGVPLAEELLAVGVQQAEVEAGEQNGSDRYSWGRLTVVVPRCHPGQTSAFVSPADSDGHGQLPHTAGSGAVSPLASSAAA